MRTAPPTLTGSITDTLAVLVDLPIVKPVNPEVGLWNKTGLVNEVPAD